MFESYVEVGNSEKQWTNNESAKVGTSFAPLVLPHFDGSVEAEIKYVSSFQDSFEIAQKLEDLGLINQKDVDKADDVDVLLERGFRNMFKGVGHKFQKSLNVSLDKDKIAYDEEPYVRVIVDIGATSHKNTITIEPLLLAMNKEVPELGLSFFKVLINEAARSFGCTSPDTIFEFICMSEWMGEDNEEFIIENMREEGGDPSEITVYTREEFDNSFGKYALEFSSFSEKDIIFLKENHEKSIYSEMISKLVNFHEKQRICYSALQTEIQEKFDDAGNDYQLPFDEVIFRWANDDDTFRMLDDMDNNWMQNGADLIDCAMMIDFHKMTVDDVVKNAEKIESAMSSREELKVILKMVEAHESLVV